jgi:hypothetical protein
MIYQNVYSSLRYIIIFSCPVVSDLLMSEALTDQKPKQKSLTKSADSGHDSGQSSLNTGELLHLITILI